MAIPGSEVGLPECEIPPGQNCERVKGARMPAQPSGVARELIPPQGGGRPDGICRPSSKGVTAVFCEPEAEKNSVKRGIIPL